MFHTWLLELTEVEPINLLKETYNDLTWALIQEALCIQLLIKEGPYCQEEIWSAEGEEEE